MLMVYKFFSFSVSSVNESGAAVYFWLFRVGFMYSRFFSFSLNLSLLCLLCFVTMYDSCSIDWKYLVALASNYGIPFVTTF